MGGVQWALLICVLVGPSLSSIDHCATYGLKTADGRETCFKCDGGHYEANMGTTCNKCKAPCKECHYSGDHCTECNPGFLVEDYSCRACLPNCLRCNRIDTCRECESGYFLAEKGLCGKCPVNCLKCSSSTVCLECAPGMSVSKSTAHQICIDPRAGSIGWAIAITTISLISLIFVTSWWRARQQRMIAESEQIIQGPSQTGTVPVLEQGGNELTDFSLSHIEHRQEDITLDDYQLKAQMDKPPVPTL